MKTIILSLFFLIGILACGNKPEKIDIEKEQKRYKEEQERIRIIDSIYVNLGEKNNSRINWEEFKYRYLYELQEYLEKEGTRLTLKNLLNYDYEIYKQDTSYILSFEINEFSNTIYLDLVFPKELLNDFRNQDRLNNEIHEIFVIDIQELKPILFEYDAIDDDYYSKILIQRSKSLIGKGEIVDIAYYKKKKIEETQNEINK